MIIAPETLAEEMRYGRHVLNYTQADLAKKAGVGISLISRIEKGHGDTVAFGTLQRLLRLVGREFMLTEGITYESAPALELDDPTPSTLDEEAYMAHVRQLFEVKK